MFIRIIATPPGEAPEEVRQAWLGLELPLVAGETGPRTVPTSGVLTGPRSFLGTVWKRLSGRCSRARGYVIDAPQALVLLAEKAPSAARWWRECAPHCWEPGYRFIFHVEVCAEVATRKFDPHSAPSNQTPSEEFYPASLVELSHKPSLRHRIVEDRDI